MIAGREPCRGGYDMDRQRRQIPPVCASGSGVKSSRKGGGRPVDRGSGVRRRVDGRESRCPTMARPHAQPETR